jgi:homoserine dehydrogenase
MRTIPVCMVGFGNVGKALVRLLDKKQPILRDQFGFETIITGIATGKHGFALDPSGIDGFKAIQLADSGQSLASISKHPTPMDNLEFIRQCNAQVMFENTPVNHHTGQPAADHLKTALECGMHAITANKGPVVHQFAELSALATKQDRRFLFESAVMDGAPIFSLFRGPLPTVELKGFHGILNSCTNLLLELMENGKSFDEAVEYGKSIGITETDPSADIDGWDAAIKVSALATVLMGMPLKPDQVDRTGIRAITRDMITEALNRGERWKLVCSCKKDGNTIIARVAPQRVPPTSPLYCINGTSSFVQFEMDTLPGLGILESNPGPETTAYGLLADLINAVRGA